MLQNTGNMKMNFQTRNPFNGEVIATYECDDLDGVNAKIGTVNDRFNAWRRVPPGERATLLQKALTYFDANRDVIAREITGQMGKPLRQAKNEVATFFERADYLLTTAEETLAPEALPEKDGLCRRIEHVPLGTVMIFAAWNYPLLIAVNGVLAALLAGNSVVLKHARATLSIGEHFEKAFGRIEGHEGLLKHIVADHDTLAEVLQESNIHHVVFTGSVEGGQAVYQSTAKRAIECHLELGGKDGAFVDADTDPVKAAEVLVDGAMYNAGQSCCGIERVYAHEEIYDVFVETCRELMTAYRLGDPMEDDTDLGPLIHANAAEKMEAQMEDARRKGARVLCGGKKRLIGHGTFFEPTLLTDVTHNMDVMREENFGPIMPVMKVSGYDEAVALINDSQYGLTSAIFTRDDRMAEQFSVDANTGTVFRNRCDYLDPALPWTGVKDSGKGSGLSRFGFYGLTRRKAIHFRQKL